MTGLLLGGLALCIWLLLWLAWGQFWRIERDALPAPPGVWPAVTAVIPARNEADGIGETLRSLWRQDYNSGLRIVLVDDHSEDGTAEAALHTAREMGREADLEIVAAPALPPGWAGKVWAMQQGLEQVGRRQSAGGRWLTAEPLSHDSRLTTHDSQSFNPQPSTLNSKYILFSDADISHGPQALEELVRRAEAGPCDLVSFMVRLQCRTWAERLMIPAFVFFFRMLYPFRKVNDPRSSMAGAAGGTMLVRWEALERIGGLEAIRGAVIDDCALARELKRGGHRIWLGLSESSVSTRGYGSLGEIVRMISRTAYSQLRYSPAVLLGCLIGLGVTFLLPPLLALFGHGWARVLGGLAWVLMALLYLPMVRFYRQSPLWAVLLPVTAVLYLWATILSAWLYHAGRGGEWKGRRV